AAAEAATTQPAIGRSGLPDGYTELARGPLDDPLLLTSSVFESAGGTAGASAGAGAGVAVSHADPSDGSAARPAIVGVARPGPASAVDLLRLWSPDAHTSTVRGHHAVIGRSSEPPGSAGESGVVSVRWAEAEGQVVTVVGYGVAEDVVRQVAEGMRSAD